MNSDLYQYFNYPLVRQTYERYNELWNRNKRFQYLNYFGINFDSADIASFKIYFHVFHELTQEDVLFFLPATVDFYKYYHLCDLSKRSYAEQTGFAFTIKFKKENEHPSVGFHYNLKPVKESYNLIGKPKLLPFDVGDLKIHPGINYEYSDKSVLIKQYYYFDKDEHKTYFAERFGYDFLKKARFIEYTESEKFSKINAWGHNPDYSFMLNRFTPEENRVIDSLCREFEIKNTVFGYYENSDIRSTYFVSLKSGNVGGSQNSYRDTLKQIYRTG